MSRFLHERLFDQSLRVTGALGRASEQAWWTLELALAGESVLTVADRAEDKAFREQVRLFDSTNGAVPPAAPRPTATSFRAV